MIDKELFVELIAEELYDNWNEDCGMSDVYDMDEVHDLGLIHPMTTQHCIEELGDWVYWTIYVPFLNQNQDLVELINDKVEEIKRDNYDPRDDDMRTYMRMVLG